MNRQARKVTPRTTASGRKILCTSSSSTNNLNGEGLSATETEYAPSENRIDDTRMSSRSNRLVILDKRPDELHASIHRVRKPGKKQRDKLIANLERFGCVMPILIKQDGEIIDGHLVWEACKALDLTIPTLIIDHLNEAQIRALRISLHKLSQMSSWDETVLREEFTFLNEFDPELLAATAFELPEIDIYLSPVLEDKEERIPEPKGPAVSLLRDLWLFEGGHRLLCGNAREPTSYQTLMGGETAAVLATDPPYGCRIEGYASKVHADFREGCNLTADELRTFLSDFLQQALPALHPGALTYIFMDGRGLHALFDTIAAKDLTFIDCCVWDKVNPGMGSFYRKQAEFAVVSQKSGGKHINNVELGRHGRNRSNVWAYPGMAGFGKIRNRDLALHPTVKPVGIIADLILDASKRQDIVLDPFSGSGTTLVAAHRTGRRGYVMELDPLYVDVAISRMQQLHGLKAQHAQTGLSFEELKKQRLQL